MWRITSLEFHADHEVLKMSNGIALGAYELLKECLEFVLKLSGLCDWVVSEPFTLVLPGHVLHIVINEFGPVLPGYALDDLRPLHVRC